MKLLKFKDFLKEAIKPEAKNKLDKKTNLKDFVPENNIKSLEKWLKAYHGYAMAMEPNGEPSVTTIVEINGDVVEIHYPNWTKEIVKPYTISKEAKELEASLNHFKKFNDGLTWEFVGKQKSKKYADGEYPIYLFKVGILKEAKMTKKNLEQLINHDNLNISKTKEILDNLNKRLKDEKDSFAKVALVNQIANYKKILDMLS